jgi:hypothetical protein
MNPGVKRFKRDWQAVYDTVARLDIDQELRDTIAGHLADALRGSGQLRGTAPELFRLLASDPLCMCAGPHPQAFHEACPDGRELRVGMHLSSAPDGRAKSWSRKKPVVRCMSCGAEASEERAA